jgi:hypothetical protein
MTYANLAKMGMRATCETRIPYPSEVSMSLRKSRAKYDDPTLHADIKAFLVDGPLETALP